MSAPASSTTGSPMSVGQGFSDIDVPVDRRVRDVRGRVAGWRSAGETIALVPTVGALHAGHDLLIQAARQAASRTVVALLPTPVRLFSGEEKVADPADELADLRRISKVGADSCWVPAPELMIPPGVETRVRVGGLAELMEGLHREDALDWTTTALTKLIIQVEPDAVVFADRDYQLLLIIARIAADLDLPVRIVAAATAREPDGLAVSAATAQLDPAARAIAAAVPQTLSRISRRLADGVSSPQAEIAWGRDQLAMAGISVVEYLDVRDPRTLECVTTSGAPARVFVAVRLGDVRLVDSVAVG